ncbi:MAG: DUF1549 domain-containing protein [Rhodothermales bacterium]|nr:DUF1549 domain-containing protein [Rhodothermales bacterium]
MDWIPVILGRLHPMIVHFPITLLLVALVVEGLTWKGQRPNLEGSKRLLVALGAASAVVAAGMGLLLADAESFAGQTVVWHKWSGVATALLALAAFLLLRRETRRPSPEHRLQFRAALALASVGVGVAGHFGASLTHGETYLTEVLPWNQAAPTALDPAIRYALDAGEPLTDAQRIELNMGVRSIFAHNCYKCHSSNKVEGGLRLDEKEFAFLGGDSGPTIVPGRSGNSELIRRLLLPRNDEESMPEKRDALPGEDIALIRLWIDDGAYWPDSLEYNIFREAPLAPRKPELPAIAGGLKHPVDRLVDRYFEANAIAWDEPVDDRRFIRRAYLDAIGLIPLPEEVDRFVADGRPDKRERLVDALLARDEDYAAHWLSFWNDLLRNDYSGPGYIDGGRRQITRWLYDALRDNMPYDTMVRALIDASPESDGFVKGIKWRGAVNASQRVELQAAQNISQSLLGLNLKCASCHDSFVSNTKLDEAYAFANVFADTTLEIFRCDKPTGRLAETAFIFPELGTIDGTAPVSERLVQLADLVTHPDNGRLQRTLVNRYWARLLGRGLVEPVDEMDRLPWDQDVLDWLASDFSAGGQDLRVLLRTIMTSRVYQLPARTAPSEDQVRSESFAFTGPLVRRLTAEQFADAVSEAVAPVYVSVAFNPEAQSNPPDASWIWYPDIHQSQNAYPGARYFRAGFDTPGAVQSASLLATADHAYKVYINGRLALEADNWRTPERLDVAGLLKPGRNLVAVEAVNEGTVPNPAGVLLSLQLTFDDGSIQRVESGQGWKTLDSLAAGWNEPGFDDVGWLDVQRKSHSLWGYILQFTHEATDAAPAFARASLVYNDDFLKALGRESRETVITSRPTQTTLLQALEMTNGDRFYETMQIGAEHWHAALGASPAVLVDSVYASTLSRPPTDAERRVALDLLGAAPDTTTVQDLLWALVMLPEFQLIY